MPAGRWANAHIIVTVLPRATSVGRVTFSFERAAHATLPSPTAGHVHFDELFSRFDNDGNAFQTKTGEMNVYNLVVAIFLLIVGFIFTFWSQRMFELLLASYRQVGIQIAPWIQRMLNSRVNIISFRVGGVICIFASAALMCI